MAAVAHPVLALLVFRDDTGVVPGALQVVPRCYDGHQFRGVRRRYLLNLARASTPVITDRRSGPRFCD